MRQAYRCRFFVLQQRDGGGAESTELAYFDLVGQDQKGCVSVANVLSIAGDQPHSGARP